MQYKYDCIISLGGNCAVANNLKFRGLRQYSLPFDWLLEYTPDFLENACTHIEERFSRWLHLENLIFYNLSREEGFYGRHKVLDTGAERIFLHDFCQAPLSKEEFDSVKEKYARRIERFYTKIYEARNVLFCVFVTKAQISKERLISCKRRLEKVFPNKEINFFAVILESNKSELQEWENEGIYISYVARAINIYDYANKSSTYEWQWLDKCGITAQTSMDVANKNEDGGRYPYYEPIIYKIYKHLRKWLRKKGRLSKSARLKFDE